MSLDFPTLLFLLSVVQVATAVIVWLLYRLHRAIPGPRDWVTGKMVHGSGLLIGVWLGADAGYWGMTAAHAIQLAGVLFLLRGFAGFAGRALPWRLLILLPPGYVALAALAAGDPLANTVRALTFLAVIAVVALLCSWVLLWRMPRHNVAQGFAGILWGVVAVIATVNLLFVFRSQPTTTDLMWSETVPDAMRLMVGWVIVHAILLAGAMIMMVADRLRNELNTRITELDRSRRVAETALSEQRNFLVMVSHEFRSPLSIIGASAAVIDANLPAADTESAEEIARIERVTSRLSALVEACLADDWMESATAQADLPPCSLRGCVEAVASEHKVPLLWTLGADPTIRADGLLLPVAFSCLIDNARKYGRDADDARVLCRPAGHDGGWISVAILDDGPGLTASELALLSQKYRRGGTPNGASGMGLGLYLARRIVDLHGGEISVCGGGETGIQVLLPIVAPSSAEVAAPTEGRRADRISAPAVRMT